MLETFYSIHFIQCFTKPFENVHYFLGEKGCKLHCLQKSITWVTGMQVFVKLDSFKISEIFRILLWSINNSNSIKKKQNKMFSKILLSKNPVY